MRRNIGIYNLQMQAMGGGEKLTLVLAEHLSQSHNVSLFCAEPVDTAHLEQFFDVDLSRITVGQLSAVGPLMGLVERVRGYSGPAFSLHHYRQLRRFNFDIFINSSYASELICPAAQGIFLCMFPHPHSNHLPSGAIDKARRKAADSIEKLLTESDTVAALHSYSKVVAISQYSAEWVRQLWNRNSEIIYPPCDDMGPAVTKRNMILNVGRFIADAGDERNYKNQRLLLDAFKQMVDLHRDGWELHLAGSVARDDNSKRLAETLQQEASGFPVHFHFNATREELRGLYQEAPIYWHATGYGFDSSEHPAKQEHFGITTVEAMSAGAVPIVYGSGGQKEIVTHGVDGLHWSNLEELKTQTKELASDSFRRFTLGERAVVTSKRFGKEAFGARVDRLIAELLQTAGGDRTTDR